jgi:hypothetical protein
LGNIGYNDECCNLSKYLEENNYPKLERNTGMTKGQGSAKRREWKLLWVGWEGGRGDGLWRWLKLQISFFLRIFHCVNGLPKLKNSVLRGPFKLKLLTKFLKRKCFFFDIKWIILKELFRCIQIFIATKLDIHPWWIYRKG